MKISVVIPTLNEELSIGETLEKVNSLENICEIILVDGGSLDKTLEIARKFGLKTIQTKPGRGLQLDAGARAAKGDVFWFLHADTRPVQGCGKQIKKYMRYAEIVGGNFHVIFDGNTRWARFLTWLYPQLRSTGLVYGDSAMFARRETYEQVKGFKSLPLFEDVDLYKRLLKKGRFVHVNLPVTTSSRRFENRSFVWTFLRWSIFQGLYWFGVPPRLLAKNYKRIR